VLANPNDNSSTRNSACKTRRRANVCRRHDLRSPRTIHSFRINRIRAEQGLSQLRLNYKLCAMARSHSSNMAGSGYLSHTDSLGRGFKERLGSKTVERCRAGENVGTNNFPDSARVAVEGWRQSPKHLKNILNEKFTDTGIGVAVNSEGLVFFTQIFLGK